MKHISKILSFISVIVAFAACNKVDDLAKYAAGTAPVLSSSSAVVAPLPSDSLNTVFTLTWTNPGHATAGVWNNPVPVPSQEFARLDETTWAGVFQLTGGNQYLLLPVNGDWTHKFAVADNSIAGLSAGGNFGLDLSSNFPAPAASGLYKIVVDFQAGKFTVTPYASVLPTNLYIVGDATSWGWNNPVPVATQQFTRLNSSVFELTVPLIGGKQYLLLPLNGDWTHKYAVNDNTITGLAQGGEFKYDASSNFPGPSASGTYKISVNFAAPTTTAGASGKFTVQ